MTAQIIDGKLISNEIKSSCKKLVEQLKVKGIVPGLAVVMVGDDEASDLYVKNKEKACKEVGIYSEKYQLKKSVTEKEVVSLIERLNTKKNIHGILVQLPMPSDINENKVINSISKVKDVDGFVPHNVGEMVIGNHELIACTPYGVFELLKRYKIEIKGKECVIVGSSNIVGKPMAMLMVNNGATVTICNIFTKDLKYHCRNADILVVAVGKEKLITSDMVKPGSVVIDVGMNRDEHGNLCGDVDFENVKKIAGYITPVPGGVGPMTVAMLLKNTIYCCKTIENN